MIYLGIGTNIGDRLSNLRNAIKRLDKIFNIIDISLIYETLAWGNIYQNNFYNIVCSIDSEYDLLGVLKKINIIEEEMGRVRKEKWGPRIIDIDIIISDNSTIENKILNVPHKYLRERDFFMKPLLQIAPDIKDPVSNKCISTYLEKLSNSQITIIRIVDDEI
jgi:2-amino-4-hydroxy-6-hydroxymethyldihydropteridine diphosphokinase